MIIRPSEQALEAKTRIIYEMIDAITEAAGKANGVYLDEVRAFVEAGDLKLAVCFVERNIHGIMSMEEHPELCDTYSDPEDRKNYVQSLIHLNVYIKSTYFDFCIWDSIDKTYWEKVEEAGSRAESNRQLYLKEKKDSTVH